MRGTRNWILAVAVAVILGGAVLVGIGLTGSDDGGGGSGSGGVSTVADTARISPSAKPSPTGPTAEQLAAIERAKRVKALDAALKKYAPTVGEFSVAVLDRKTGQLYAYRGDEPYETASVVKVQVLACLLLTAQDADRKLTATEDAQAKTMIRNSDNDATTALFNKLGRYTAIGACNKRLGLTQTKVNTQWGLTKTTVKDQMKLLTALVDAKGPLNADSRAYAHLLMSTVAENQDWGVPAAAKAGEKFTVKNGWLSRSTEGGRFIINSVGRITGKSTDISIAVLSHQHKTESGGIAVVEKVAKLTRTHLKY